MNAPACLFLFSALALVACWVADHWPRRWRRQDSALPAPDLRRVERAGSVEYFIRASRGVTKQ